MNKECRNCGYQYKESDSSLKRCPVCCSIREMSKEFLRQTFNVKQMPLTSIFDFSMLEKFLKGGK